MLLNRFIILQALLATVGLCSVASPAAHAQTADRQMTSYLTASNTVRCGWTYWWDPPDGFGDIDVSLVLGDSGRSFHTTGNGLFGYAHVEIELNGTYLPSTSYQCGSFGIILWPAWIYYFDWEYHQLQHNNPDCDGFPPLLHGYHPGVRTYVDESLYDPAHVYIWQGFVDGQYYWGNVGQELNYTDLNSMNGPSDVWVGTSASLPPMFQPTSMLEPAGYDSTKATGCRRLGIGGTGQRTSLGMRTDSITPGRAMRIGA
jgi:hypothetical protein